MRPLAGRDFVDGDDGHDARPVLLLSHRFWMSQFQGDPTILGADFTMNDRVHTVVGILPPLPPAPHDIDVWMPVSACPFRSGEGWAHDRTSRGLTTIARLAPGASLESAAVEVSTLAAGLAKSFPDAYPERLGLAPRVVPLRDAMTISARPTLWLLGAASLLVLLLVGANLVNLTLAQMAQREGEFAMRAAVGGTSGRLARQMVTESTVLCLAGGALGLGLAIAGQAMLVRVLGRLTLARLGVDHRRGHRGDRVRVVARPRIGHRPLAACAVPAHLPIGPQAGRPAGGAALRRRQHHGGRPLDANARPVWSSSRWRCRSCSSSARRCSCAASATWIASSRAFSTVKC